MDDETKDKIISFVFMALIIIGGSLALIYSDEIELWWEDSQTKIDQEKFLRVKENCDFVTLQTKYGYECDIPCLEHSLDNKTCVPKGCVTTGGFFTNTDCDWYICEGFGDIKPDCLRYYDGTKEEYCNQNLTDGERSWYCLGWHG